MCWLLWCLLELRKTSMFKGACEPWSCRKFGKLNAPPSLTLCVCVCVFSCPLADMMLCLCVYVTVIFWCQASVIIYSSRAPKSPRKS